MSTERPSPEELQSRIDELARNVRRLRLVTTILVAMVVVFIAGLFFPELLGGLALLAFMGAILLGTLLFISGVMGLLEWWSPSGRLEEVQRSVDAAADSFSPTRS